MKLAIFIDYDNLLETHKSAGVRDVTSKALLRTPFFCNPGPLRGTCDVRIYGGWYEGASMTLRAQDLAVQIQNEFPLIIRLPYVNNSTLLLNTTAELAMSMMEEPGYHLFDTYRKKRRPGNLLVTKPEDVACTHSGCLLPALKKLLKKGNCPIAACCVPNQELVTRDEQKIVDTMLTCDMIYAPKLDYDQVILLSGDDDFVPAIRTLSLRGTPVVRFYPQASINRKPLSILGKPITEIDL